MTGPRWMFYGRSHVGCSMTGPTLDVLWSVPRWMFYGRSHGGCSMIGPTLDVLWSVHVGCSMTGPRWMFYDRSTLDVL